MRIKEMIANLRSCDFHTNSPFQCQRKCIKKSMENMDAYVRGMLEENLILVKDDTLYHPVHVMFSYHLPAFAWNCFNIGKKDNYIIPSVSLRVTRYSSLVQSVIQSNIQTGIIMHQTSVLWKSSHFVLYAILMHISVKSHEYQVYTTHNSQVEKHKADANLASYMTRKKYL